MPVRRQCYLVENKAKMEEQPCKNVQAPVSSLQVTRRLLCDQEPLLFHRRTWLFGRRTQLFGSKDTNVWSKDTIVPDEGLTGCLSKDAIVHVEGCDCSFKECCGDSVKAVNLWWEPLSCS